MLGLCIVTNCSEHLVLSELKHSICRENLASTPIIAQTCKEAWPTPPEAECIEAVYMKLLAPIMRSSIDPSEVFPSENRGLCEQGAVSLAWPFNQSFGEMNMNASIDQHRAKNV